MGHCPECGVSVDREGVLFCSILEESVGAEDGCETDFRPKGATCGTCGCRVAKVESETGWSCTETSYDVAMSQKACPAWEPIVESDVDESKSLSGKTIEEETPVGRRTIDFNHNNIPRFNSEYAFALAKVEQFLRDNPGEKPKITTVDVFHEDYVKTSITVTLPTNFKLELDSTDIIRENSQIRMIPPMQTDLFDHGEDTDG